MKIKLHFPRPSIDAIHAMGLRQRSPETLRLSLTHATSSNGIGVLLRGQSSAMLDGAAFAAAHATFGAWIEVDSEPTRQRVAAALCVAATGLADAIKVRNEQ